MSIDTHSTCTVSSSLKFKQELLEAALRIKTMQDYCAFAFQGLHKYLSVDSASLNLTAIESGMKIKELSRYFYRQPQSMEKSHADNSRDDFFTPLLMIQPGIALQARSLMSEGEYYETDIFINHCQYFNVHNTLSAGAGIPGHKNKYLIMYLYSADSKRLFIKKEVQFLQCIFPVLFSAWLYQLGFICKDTLKEQATLLSHFDKKPELLKLIRLIVAQPGFTSKEYAKHLKKSPKTVEHQLETIFQVLGIGVNSEIKEIRHKKIELFDLFYFLRG